MKIEILNNKSFKQYGEEITKLYNDFRCAPTNVSTSLIRRMVNGNYKIWYATDLYDRVVGFALVNVLDRDLSLDLLYVTSNYRKTGIGDKLLNRVVNYSKRNKFNTIELYVDRHAEWLHKFYEKYGFKSNKSMYGLSIHMVRTNKRLKEVL